MSDLNNPADAAAPTLEGLNGRRDLLTIVGPEADRLRKIASAIRDGRPGSSVRLTRLVDEVSTWTAIVPGLPPHEFDDREDATEWASDVAALVQAKAVSEALARSPAVAPGVPAGVVRAFLDALDQYRSESDQWGPGRDRKPVIEARDTATAARTALDAALSSDAQATARQAPTPAVGVVEIPFEVAQAARRLKLPEHAELNIVTFPYPDRCTRILGWEFSRDDEGSMSLSAMVTLARYAQQQSVANPTPAVGVEPSSTGVALPGVEAIRREAMEQAISDLEDHANELECNGSAFHARGLDLAVTFLRTRLAAAGTRDAGRDDLVAYLHRQWSWSKETFGPALRTKGIVQHITKELREIEAKPHDLSEWVDVIILAMDGFWRHGGQPENLLPALQAKQDKNFARTWPDWRTMGEDQAIEHDRSGDATPALAAAQSPVAGVDLREAAKTPRQVAENILMLAMVDVKDRVPLLAEYRAEIDEAEGWIRALDAPSSDRGGATDGWRDIATAPKDGTDVLLVNAGLVGGFLIVAAWDAEVVESAKVSGHCWWGQEASGRFGYHTDAFTHWRPLPAPPTTTGAQP